MRIRPLHAIRRYINHSINNHICRNNIMNIGDIVFKGMALALLIWLFIVIVIRVKMFIGGFKNKH